MRHSSEISRIYCAAFIFALGLLVTVFGSPVAANNSRPTAAFVSWDGVRIDGAAKAAGWQCIGKARACAAANQPGSSIFWYLEAVKRYAPLEATLAREIGYQYAQAGEGESAIAWYNAALFFRPDDVEARLGLARALSQARLLDEALAQYQAVFSLRGGLPLDLDLEIDKVTAWKNEK